MTHRGADLVELRGVVLGYRGQPAPVLDLDAFTVRAREKISLIGSTGAGKTTLLSLVDGRQRRWSGTLRILGTELRPGRRPSRELRRRVGFIFQDFALIERMTVYENVRNGRLGHVPTFDSLRGRFPAEDEAAIHAVLDELGMGEFAHRRVDRLSGGQRQRVGIARCLAQAPDLILADEPISSLDPVRAESVVRLLVEACERRGAGLVLSSHQPSVVAPYVDRVVALRGGRIAFDGVPAELDDAEAAIYGASAGAELVR